MKQSDKIEMDEDVQAFAHDLRQLFVQANEDLPGTDFEQQVALAVRRRRHVRTLWQAVLCCVLLIVVALVASPLIEGSIAMGQLVESLYDDLGPLLWIGSLLLAAWVLRRARVFR